MKNLSLSLLLLSLCQFAFAQGETSSNSLIIGGSFSFISQMNTYPFSAINVNSGLGGIFSNGTNDTRNFTFSISPYVGKELNENWMVALELDYRLASYKDEEFFSFVTGENETFERNANQFGIGVFARYLINPANQFNFYLQPYAEYNLLNEEEFRDDEMTQEEKANYIQLGASVGAIYNINERWRILLNIGGLNYVNGNWEVVDADPEQQKDFSSFGTNLSLASIRFGIELKI